MISLHKFCYLLPAAKGCGQEIVKRLPYVCIRSSCFYMNICISFTFKDIFTKFVGNVNGYENMSVQNFGLKIIENQNDHHI